MYQVFKKVYIHLSLKRRVQFCVVLFLMICGAAAEALTLGAIVPFFSLLLKSESSQEADIFNLILTPLAATFGSTPLFAAACLFAGLAVFAGVLRLILTWSSFKFVFALGADLGAILFEKILQQPYVYHINRNSSQTLAAVEKVGHFTAGVLAPSMQMFVSFVMAISIFGGMLWLSPIPALSAGLIFSALYFSISLSAKRRLIINSRLISDNSSRRLQYLQEGIGAIRDILLENNQHVYVKQFESVDRELRTAQAMNATISVAPKYIVESILIVGIVFFAYYLTLESGGAFDSIPILGVLAMGAQRLLPYVQNIYNAYASLKGNLTASTETLNLLDLKSITLNQEYPESFSPINSLIVKDVEFKYPNRDQPTFKDVSLTVKRGEKIGIIGETGSGKSTLIDIIMSLLPPTCGEIIVNDKRLNHINSSAWRKCIAHVPQSIFLCDKSIAENIALGQSVAEIDDIRLTKAIEASQLSSLILELPNGVQSGVGERGIQLSGGQRQRIGIARALYRQVDVLILDEATSALDHETESRVMREIYRLNPDIILIVIAHRISTLRECSSIYKLTQRGLLNVTSSTFSGS